VRGLAGGEVHLAYAPRPLAGRQDAPGPVVPGHFVLRFRGRPGEVLVLVAGVGARRRSCVPQELVDGVLVGLEDPGLDDLAAFNGVHVRPPDLDDAASAREPLVHEQHDPLLA